MKSDQFFVPHWNTWELFSSKYSNLRLLRWSFSPFSFWIWIVQIKNTPTGSNTSNVFHIRKNMILKEYYKLLGHFVLPMIFHNDTGPTWHLTHYHKISQQKLNNCTEKSRNFTIEIFNGHFLSSNKFWKDKLGLSAYISPISISTFSPGWKIFPRCNSLQKKKIPLHFRINKRKGPAK